MAMNIVQIETRTKMIDCSFSQFIQNERMSMEVSTEVEVIKLVWHQIKSFKMQRKRNTKMKASRLNAKRFLSLSFFSQCETFSWMKNEKKSHLNSWTFEKWCEQKKISFFLLVFSPSFSPCKVFLFREHQLFAIDIEAFYLCGKFNGFLCSISIE